MNHHQADSERSAVFGQMRGTVFGMSHEDNNVQRTYTLGKISAVVRTLLIAIAPRVSNVVENAYRNCTPAATPPRTRSARRIG